MILPLDSIHHELKAINDYITAFESVMESGHMPEMKNLEKRVAGLCRSIENAASEIQKECAPELNNLLNRINECEKKMKFFYQEHIAHAPSHD